MANPAYLKAVAEGLKAYKNRMSKTRGKEMTDAELASSLGIDATTVSKYLHEKNPMHGETLARACVDLGIEFKYKSLMITAASFPRPVEVTPTPQRQLTFAFNADYQGPKTSWTIKQDRAEPMEFSLSVKIAS